MFQHGAIPGIFFMFLAKILNHQKRIGFEKSLNSTVIQQDFFDHFKIQLIIPIGELLNHDVLSTRVQVCFQQHSRPNSKHIILDLDNLTNNRCFSFFRRKKQFKCLHNPLVLFFVIVQSIE
ncbi:hypothetical protein N9K77_01635 [bacterium]|nr:hypothetical protein [bacterium]